MEFQTLIYPYPPRSMPVQPMFENLHRGSRLSPEPVGGGEAVPRRGLGGPWLGRPLRRLTVRASQDARIISITPPLGHYEPGAVGCIGASQSRRRRAVSDRTAAWRTSRARTAWGARRLAPKTKNEPVPGVLLPCSLTVRSCEARRRREMRRATSPGGRGQGVRSLPLDALLLEIFQRAGVE